MSEKADYNRPRRPAPDTVSYLRSLPLDLELALSEIQAFRAAAERQKDGDDDNDATAAVGSSSGAATVTTTAEATLEFPPTLAAALQALYEIRHELASLAGDEHAAEGIEVLCRICCPVSRTAARLVLDAVAPYALHLATHRYGSHVLQTMLQLAPKSAATAAAATTTAAGASTTTTTVTDLALHEDAPVLPTTTTAELGETTTATTTSLNDLILGIASALEGSATDLAIHICGSHVLRSVLCLLGGVELVQVVGGSHAAHNNKINNTAATGASASNSTLRRGKVKPKKKKKKGPSTVEGGNSSTQAAASGERMVYIEGFTPSSSMKEALHRLATALTTTATATTFTAAAAAAAAAASETATIIGPGDVQRWACHSSAGPVLTVLLQVLTYQENFADSNSSSSSSSSSSSLRERQQRWDAAQATPDRHLCTSRPEPHYRISTSTSTSTSDESNAQGGAHAVVKRLLCWRTAAEKQKFGADVFYGLAGEPRGSHCLETILRLSPDEVYAELLETGKLTDPQTVREYVQDNVSNFVVQTVLQTVRTAQQAAAVLSALEPVLPYILDPSHKRRGILWRMVEMAAAFPGDCQEKVLQMIPAAFTALTASGIDGAGKPINKATAVEVPAVKLNKCIPALLSIQKPARDGDRVQVDVAGTRALYHMLRFEPSLLCKDTVKGIMELAPDEMELLTKDALGSRCVLDGILEGPLKDSVFALALKRLLAKLQGRWVAVAIDRVGHHTVKKLFRALSDVKDKEVLVKELMEGKNRMNGNSMGRSVLDALEVRAYEMNGEKEWSKLVKKNVENEEWLKEIVEGDAKVRDKQAKRKKFDPEAAISSQKKNRVSSSVDAILEAFSIPREKKP